MSSQGTRYESRDGLQSKGFLSLAAGIACLISLTACQPNMNPQGLERDEMAAGIVNGTDANGSEPFTSSLVGLASRTMDGKYSIYCSGTIVSQHMIVTAGHCLPHANNTHFVVFGLNEGALQARPIVSKVSHEKYVNWFPSSAKDVYDIGVVHFSGGLPAGYRPMPILSDDAILQPGAEVLMVGYGVTNGMMQSGSGTLRYTTVRIAEAHGLTELKTDETRSGTCNGDSGGPGLINYNGQYYLWGATSRGDSRCANHGIYTKVTSYRDWVTTQNSVWNGLFTEDEPAWSADQYSYAQ